MQTPYNLSLNRGNSSFDLRHNVVLSWTYELPVGKGKPLLGNASGPLQWIAGGWQINSIDSFQTGTPFTMTMASSLLNAGSGVQWPNRIGSGKLDNPTEAEKVALAALSEHRKWGARLRPRLRMSSWCRTSTDSATTERSPRGLVSRARMTIR